MTRGLTIVVATDDPVRWAGALAMASAHAALGGATRLFLDAAAAPLLASAPDPAFATAVELGVDIIACQTGLAAIGLSLIAVDPCVSAGGLPSLLATLGDEDRLVTW